MRPSFGPPPPAPLAAMLSAFSRPRFLRISLALALSPAASSSAFLQSIMPAPVSRRRSLTVFASMLAMIGLGSCGRRGGRRRRLLLLLLGRTGGATATAAAEAAARTPGHRGAARTAALADVDRALPLGDRDRHGAGLGNLLGLGHARGMGLALDDRVGQLVDDDLHDLHRIVVPGDRDVDLVGVAVRID